MDNRDGTLSLFGTLLDNAAPAAAPAPGTDAAAFTPDQLASVARTLGYNDPQANRDAVGAPGGPQRRARPPRPAREQRDVPAVAGCARPCGRGA